MVVSESVRWRGPGERRDAAVDSGVGPRPLVSPLVADQFGRPLRELRVSVTDRCNLRCAYCMPEQEYVWLPRHDILTLEELSQLVAVFGSLGVRKVRITGGEPLLRRDLPELVRRIVAHSSVDELAMTTNGVLLADHLDDLQAAGLQRVTVSLDTLRPERFERLTRRRHHAAVLDSLTALAEGGWQRTKIDAVVMRDINDDELADLIEFGGSVGAEVRFIEYMDVGGATGWDTGLVVPGTEILQRLAQSFGPITALGRAGSAPAGRYALADGRTFGIVASMTEPFCGTCDRSRITADGMWYRCLYAIDGTDLRTPLRDGASVDHLRQLVTEGWQARSDQGALDRLAMGRRESAVPVTLLRRDPHLEMHTRGG